MDASHFDRQDAWYRWVLNINREEYEDLRTLLEALDSRGVFIQTAAPTIEAAEELLHIVERRSRRGVHAT